MTKTVSSLMQVILVAVVLLLQFAGSSAELHRMLHGQAEAAQSCSHGEGPCGSVPLDGEEDACSDTCAVMLLSSGLTLGEGLIVELANDRLLTVLEGPSLSRSLPGSERLPEARAPPVL